MANYRHRASDRWEKIVGLVEEAGYRSVKELSLLCSASEITIRRDLEALSAQTRILRTHGGAASLKAFPELQSTQIDIPTSPRPPAYLLEQMDALIITSNTERFHNQLSEKYFRKSFPIIAESTPSPNAVTCVATDNYAAGKAVGRWAGDYANLHWMGKAYVLDLTYHLSNTLERSRGFLNGLQETALETRQLFSLNTQSRYETAYQLTRDAITTDPRINIIFAINDQSALGAIQACEDLNLSPYNLMVIPFGLEGKTALDRMAYSPYCKAGLAMFPEIAGRVCLEAAVAAYNSWRLPGQLVTPFAVIEKNNLEQFYRKEGEEWKLSPEILKKLSSLLPFHLQKKRLRNFNKTPQRIGILICFGEHEWYRNLYASLTEYAKEFQIDIELFDLEKTIQGEIELRRREIARRAAKEVRPGEVIFIDASPMAGYLADALAQTSGMTVITNSMPVMEALKNRNDVTLVGTGGVLRIGSQAFVGPTAEHAIREMRVDHLFLTVTGVSVTFGLSHTNISEVTIKQTMVRSARRVVLLADHSMFETESTIQVTPFNVIQCLITDDALPASVRMQISQLGVQVIVAGI